MAQGKLLNCIFWDDVTCKYRKSETVTMMVRCWSCREFKRFVREMDKADARIMDQIEKERSGGDDFG
jgi:hypothetical protein